MAGSVKGDVDMLANLNPYIDNTYQKLQIISQDREKRMEYEAREKAMRDHDAGMFEAEERGIVIGEERIAKLYSLMAADMRLDDFDRSITDKDLRRQLMEEYGI